MAQKHCNNMLDFQELKKNVYNKGENLFDKSLLCALDYSAWRCAIFHACCNCVCLETRGGGGHRRGSKSVELNKSRRFTWIPFNLTPCQPYI